MISVELKMLIKAAVADGDVTEKERAVLHKRAMAEGVDLDEFDMILDAELSKKREDKDSSSTAEKEDSALKILLGKIEDINNTEYKDEDGDDDDDKKNDYIIATIKNFYLPKNREELIEIAIFMKQQSEKNTTFMDCYESDIVKAYRAKYKELCEKLRMLFPGDPQIIGIIGAEDSASEKKKGFFSKFFG